MDTEKMSYEEFYELFTKIGTCTSDFLIKMIESHLINNHKYCEIEINAFISIVCASLSLINSMIIKWISESIKEITGEDISNNITKKLINTINNPFKVELH